MSAINFLAILQGDYTPLNLGWEALGVFRYFLFSGGGGFFLGYVFKNADFIQNKNNSTEQCADYFKNYNDCSDTFE